jgi:hypothetical protein
MIYVVSGTVGQYGINEMGFYLRSESIELVETSGIKPRMLVLEVPANATL